jgi:hypothetical protein
LVKEPADKQEREEVVLMFIETYYDERSAVPGTPGEPTIPYPELSGASLTLWQRYLPVKTELATVPFWLHHDMPSAVVEQLEKVQKNPLLFERIEIWSRSDDPMAVGVTGGEQTRYFSIARWGEANLTLEQVKKKLRMEKWALWLLSAVMIVTLLAGTLALVTHARQIPEWTQKALSYESFWQAG